METTLDSTADRISPDRAAASRANGQKSHGPITPEGKKISSGNSYKHGLFASIENLTRHEDPAEFQALHQGIYEKYLPKDAIELHYVETIVGCLWRLKRADTIEAKIYNSESSIVGDHFTWVSDKVASLDKSREKIEKRLKNAKAELEKAQREPTGQEIDFQKNHTPEIAEKIVQEAVDQKVEDQLREQEEKEEARRREAAKSKTWTLEDDRKNYTPLNSEQMAWLVDKLRDPDAPAGLEFLRAF